MLFRTKELNDAQKATVETLSPGDKGELYVASSSLIKVIVFFVPPVCTVLDTFVVRLDIHLNTFNDCFVGLFNCN